MDGPTRGATGDRRATPGPTGRVGDQLPAAAADDDVDGIVADEDVEVDDDVPESLVALDEPLSEPPDVPALTVLLEPERESVR